MMTLMLVMVLALGDEKMETKKYVKFQVINGVVPRGSVVECDTLAELRFALQEEMKFMNGIEEYIDGEYVSYAKYESFIEVNDISNEKLPINKPIVIGVFIKASKPPYAKSQLGVKRNF